MPKLIFSLELELQFLQVYHEVASSSQGKMLSQVERLIMVAKRLSKFCKEAGLDDFEWTAKLCKNKLDTIRKKAKRLYDKLKEETRTGSAVEDGFNREVSNAGVFLTTD